MTPAQRSGPCPVCNTEQKWLTDHLRRSHREEWERDYKKKTGRGVRRVVGEELVIGPTPQQPTVIQVKNGTAVRVLKTYMLPMNEVVDVIAGALRQALDKDKWLGAKR